MSQPIDLTFVPLSTFHVAVEMSIRPKVTAD